MPTPIRFYSAEEFGAAEHNRREKGLTFLEAFGPGAAWHCPWFHDPADAKDISDLEHGYHAGFLSVHYLATWARTRPPIMTVTPNGKLWCIDQSSSNGTGWVVTGDVPNLTAMPSIVVPGYHGWLRDGAFSDDVEGRGPVGEISAR